ncbi:MAG: CYTH domain-containing protein [Candidatus Uhrbacteria bacterium]
MDIEYEATFWPINKDQAREKLRVAGAALIKPEFLQKRKVFNLPKGHEIKGGWLRVRDEGDKITMSLKVVDGDKIENQKELCLKVDSFTEAVEFLKTVGCQEKAYQETKREKWEIDDVEITIDEWPFLEPFVEVEGKSETEVKAVADKLGFDWSQAMFGATNTLYAKKYGIDEKFFTDVAPLIIFEMENPFLKFFRK